MKISEIITDKYKLRIPPTVYYELLADVREVEEEQKPTTKNDLGVDAVSRQQAIERLKLNFPISDGADNSRDRHRYMQALADIQAIRELPSVTPQEPQTFKWCETCKEYDQENHCCHRWSKVIRDTVEEMKQDQEPKPMVEIDLYSVIKQKYIEREVLDKIRAEIDNALSDGMIHKKTVLGIIDKYKAETEAEDGNDD